jgi:phospholipase A1
VAFNLLGRRNASLWFAYSQQAHWQAYNSDISSPFRDTNHEPEAFLSLQNKTSLLGIKPTLIRYGVIHQSNGQIEPISRSWNRIYADFVFEKADTVISFKPWYRLPEATAEDDNPNIERYLGYAELTAVHVFDDYSIDLLLRNNLRKDNKGTFQLGFSFPAWGKMRGYVQYFNGYGQSLLDYNNKTQSIGLGVMLTNWL